MTEILSDKQIYFNADLRTFKLRAGRYLVIDPCYIFGNDNALWDRICNALFPNKETLEQLVMSIDNDKVYIFGTNSGDGVYPVYQESVQIGDCGVDAGLLSFIPKEVIDGIENADDGLGVWVDIVDDAKVFYEEGDVTVGDLFVDTSFTNENYNDDDSDDSDLTDDDE